MKSELRANSTKERRQESAAATSTQDHTKSKLDSTTVNSRDTDRRHFRRWWNEYQKKMKSAFHGAPLKLQTQAEQ